MGSQNFCLKWNNHHGNLVDVFDGLLSDEIFVDVTLACEGLTLKVHKVVLSACSSFFKDLFRGNPCQHPIVFMNGISFSNLQTIVQFMYRGEVNVSQDELPTLLKTAESLKVKGLAEVSSDTEKLPEPALTKRKRKASGFALANHSHHLRSHINDLPPDSTDKDLSDDNHKSSTNETECEDDFQKTETVEDTVETINVDFDEPKSPSESHIPVSTADSPDIAVCTIKSSPHSSPEHVSCDSSDNISGMSIDPNQYLLQNFSESVPNKSDDSSNPDIIQLSNTSDIYHGPNKFEDDIPSSTQAAGPSGGNSFTATSAFIDQYSSSSDLSTSFSQSMPASSQLPTFPTTMSMNAVGVTMSEVSGLDSNSQERLWSKPCGRPGRKASWSRESLNAAMNAVIEKKWNVTAAARKFGIPQPTLYSYIAKFFRRPDMAEKCLNSGN